MCCRFCPKVSLGEKTDTALKRAKACPPVKLKIRGTLSAINIANPAIVFPKFFKNVSL